MAEDIAGMWERISNSLRSANEQLFNYMQNSERLTKIYTTAKSGVKTAGAYGLGGFAVADPLFSMYSSMSQGDSFIKASQKFIIEAKKQQIEWMAYGKAMQVAGQSFFDSTSKMGVGFQKAGNFMKDFMNVGKWMDDVITGLSGKTNLLAKSMTGLATATKIAVGTIGTSIAVASVA